MARYRDAIQWLANSCLKPPEPDDDVYPETVEIVAKLFGKECRVVERDALNRQALDRVAHQRAIDAEYDEEDRMMDEREAG